MDLKNKHHLINKCRADDGYNVSHPDNVKPMIIKDHVNHHNYLGNMTSQNQSQLEADAQGNYDIEQQRLQDEADEEAKYHEEMQRQAEQEAHAQAEAEAEEKHNRECQQQAEAEAEAEYYASQGPGY